MEELRKSVAELLGEPADWPDHGNAPLAIAATMALLHEGCKRLEAENAALKREAHTWWTAARDALAQRQSREGAAEDLYGRLESLSKAMECSGRIDEHDHPDAYGAILDAMKYVQADLNVPETQPGATGFDGADAWNAHGA